ncbi:MAG: hypothetical protein GOMPHAMPRED_001545 [Gomphillus americanus]|uniref:Uncharacterized protein n=1 Tax=Gomphillus americanus TaxID=1940652 RepID=A0A8H3I876_9LECA|nr:MAG: hypothetical protein GOMPHAMPRED_001545 [Gomphillus americanus]
MHSSRLSFTFLYLWCSFSNAQFPDISPSVSKWTTVTESFPAVTITRSGGTFTEPAKTVVGGDANDGYGLPGISHVGNSIISIVAPTTVTELATTATQGARIETSIEAPAALVSELILPILYDMEDAAPDVTSLPISVASKLNAGWTSLWGSYTSAHPMPSIIDKFDSDFRSIFYFNDLAVQPLHESILDNLIEYPDATQSASIASALSSLLAPYPTLASEVSGYMTALETWHAPQILAEYSLIRSELSITTPAPTWLSRVSDFLPAATSASAGGANGTSAGGATSSASHGSALPIRGASVFVNAGIAVASIAVILLM